MTTRNADTVPLQEPLDLIEQQLIRAYVAGAGHDLDALLARNDEEARKLLADASQYASEKLSEVEARSHYLRSLRGEA
jgi:hypothetical protein